jgi:hypothetical protein
MTPTTTTRKRLSPDMCMFACLKENKLSTYAPTRGERGGAPAIAPRLPKTWAYLAAQTLSSFIPISASACVVYTVVPTSVVVAIGRHALEPIGHRPLSS